MLFLNSARTVLLAFLIFLSYSLAAQVDFEGPASPISILNTAADENYLSISPDETILSFSRLKSATNQGAISNPGNIWQVEIDSVFGSAYQIDVNDSTMLNISLGGVGKVHYFAEIEAKYGTYYTKVFRSETGSKSKKEAQIPYLTNKSPFISGNISKDGNYMVLSLEGTTSYGVEDLYVCQRRTDGSWSSPKNLGPGVNSAFQEFTPFLLGDDILYWSSNGRSGEGSFDIFFSKRLDDTWQNWSQPKGIGKEINTQGAETSFQVAGDYAYFVSTQDSDGYGDVKRIKLAEPFEENDSISYEEQLYITRTISILDESTGEPVPASIIVKSQSIDSTFQGAKAEVNLLELEDLTLEVEAPKYFPEGSVYTSSALDTLEVIQIRLKPLVVGATVNLQNVLFQRATTDFVGGSEKELERVVKMLQDNPDLKILVKGHTDNRGNAVMNMDLSQRRAQKVMDFLIESGVEEERVSSQGFGGTVPIASNEDEFTRKLNRRVEFTVLEQ